MKAVESPTCVGTALIPACNAADAASQLEKTAVSHTATFRVTVAPGLNPARVAKLPGPPVAAGFQLPGYVVVETRNGDGTKDWFNAFSETP